MDGWFPGIHRRFYSNRVFLPSLLYHKSEENVVSLVNFSGKWRLDDKSSIYQQFCRNGMCSMLAKYLLGSIHYRGYKSGGVYYGSSQIKVQ